LPASIVAETHGKPLMMKSFNVLALGALILLAACASTGEAPTGGQAHRDLMERGLYEDNLTKDSRLADSWKVVDEKLDTPLSGGTKGALPSPSEDDANKPE
jgi:hypothetical protein